MNKAIITITLLFISLSLNAAKQAPITNLDIKNAKKLEIRSGQIGPRSTLIFYTFKSEKAVLKIHIDNKDKSFPVTATVFVFDKSVSEEDLKKWLNNQHSDGLFPNIPKPSKNIKVPAKIFKLLSKKVTGNKKGQFGSFENYNVKLKADEYSDKISIKIKSFTIDTQVYLKTK